MKSYIRNMTVAALAIAAISGCQKKEPSDSSGVALALASGSGGSSSGSSEWGLHFSVRAAGQEISCSQQPGSTAVIANVTNDGTTHKIYVQDMRFYISNIKLIDIDDNEVAVTLESNNFQDPASGVVLLDFEDKSNYCTNGTTETHRAVQMTYPAGTYKGIKFDVGIPDPTNRLYWATTPATGTPRVFIWSGMYWSWAGAYKFTKLEFKDTVANLQTVLHLGSTGTPGSVATNACDDVTNPIPATADNINPGVANPCTRPNRPTISLSKTGFDPLKDTIVFDLATLFSGANTTWAAGAGGTCMSGRASATTLKPPCQHIMPNIGVVETNGASGVPKAGVFTLP